MLYRFSHGLVIIDDHRVGKWTLGGARAGGEQGSASFAGQDRTGLKRGEVRSTRAIKEVFYKGKWHRAWGSTKLQRPSKAFKDRMKARGKDWRQYENWSDWTSFQVKVNGKWTRVARTSKTKTRPLNSAKKGKRKGKGKK